MNVRKHLGRDSCALVLTATLLLVDSEASAGAVPDYRITRLASPSYGYSEGAGINDSGSVVGYAWVTGDQSGRQPHVWHADGTDHPLPPLRYVAGIGDNGIVAGEARIDPVWTTTDVPVLWHSGEVRDLGVPRNSRSHGVVNAISSNGKFITGWHSSLEGNYNEGPAQAFLWSDKGYAHIESTDGRNLGQLFPVDVNNAGMVVGTWHEGFADRAFLWRNGLLSDISPQIPENMTLWGVTAHAINDAGTVALTAWTRNAEGTGAVSIPLLMAADGSFTALPVPDAARFAEAVDISDTGIAIGWYGQHEPYQQRAAALWQNGVFYDLAEISDAGTNGWSRLTAVAINSRGQITGIGSIGGETHAFLLTPVPEPETYLLITMGLVGIGVITRRRARGSHT